MPAMGKYKERYESSIPQLQKYDNQPGWAGACYPAAAARHAAAAARHPALHPVAARHTAAAARYAVTAAHHPARHPTSPACHAAAPARHAMTAARHPAAPALHAARHPTSAACHAAAPTRHPTAPARHPTAGDINRGELNVGFNKKYLTPSWETFHVQPNIPKNKMENLGCINKTSVHPVLKGYSPDITDGLEEPLDLTQKGTVPHVVELNRDLDKTTTAEDRRGWSVNICTADQQLKTCTEKSTDQAYSGEKTYVQRLARRAWSLALYQNRNSNPTDPTDPRTTVRTNGTASPVNLKVCARRRLEVAHHPYQRLPPRGDTNPNQRLTPRGDTNPYQRLTPRGDTDPNQKLTPRGDTDPNQRLTPRGDTNQCQGLPPQGDTNPNQRLPPRCDTDSNQRLPTRGDTDPNQRRVPRGDTNQCTGPHSRPNLCALLNPHVEPRSGTLEGWRLGGGRPEVGRESTSLSPPQKESFQTKWKSDIAASERLSNVATPARNSSPTSLNDAATASIESDVIAGRNVPAYNTTGRTLEHVTPIVHDDRTAHLRQDGSSGRVKDDESAEDEKFKAMKDLLERDITREREEAGGVGDPSQKTGLELVYSIIMSHRHEIQV